MPVQIDSKIAGDKVAVSRANQVDNETAATIDKLILFDETSYLRQERNAETNEAEKTGEIEATDVQLLSRNAVGQLNQAKATPDGIAWAFQKMFGAPTTTTLGTSGYKHVFKLENYPDNPALFTAAHRKGGASTGLAPADYERHRGCAVGSLEFTAAKDAFLQMALGVLGIGYVDDATYTEIIADVSFDSGFTFVITKDVQGSTDAIRKDKIFAMADLDDDGVYETELTIASYAQSTNTATFTDPSSSGDHDVRVTYEVDEAESGYTWRTQLDGLSSQDEFLLKATNMRLYLGAGIDASGAAPVRTGGQFGECELAQFTYGIDWSAEPGRCWRVLASESSDYAQTVDIGAPVQRVTLQRRVRDWLIKQHYDANTHFGIEINAIGPEIDSGEANYFGVWIYLPRCKILTKEQEPADDKWSDTVEVAVLKEEGGSDPTCVVVVQNAVASYAIS